MFQINLELFPTHIEGQPLTLFERHVLAAIQQLGDTMTQARDELKAELKNVQDKLATEGAELSTLTGSIKDIATAAVKDALAAADADDATVTAALKQTEDTIDAQIGAIHDATVAVAPAPTGDPAPAPAPEPAPEPVALSFAGPAGVTGVSGTPVSGQFSAVGGTGPYTFAQDGAVGDFTTTADGFYAMNPTSPATGTVNIVVTDAAGATTDPATVTISVG
jgi:hypothetical protein